MIVLIYTWPTDSSHDIQMFCKEVLVAKQVHNVNVLAIEGVQIGAHTLCIVSEWMDNGNLLTYLEKNDGANRAELVGSLPRSRCLLSDS